MKALRLDNIKQPPPKPARTTNTALYLPPGGNAAWISPYIARASGGAGVFLTFAKNFGSAAQWYDQLMHQREQIDAELPGLSWRTEANGKIWIETEPIRDQNLDAAGERDRVISFLAQKTNAMVNVFRHRLELIQRLQEAGGLCT